MSHAVPVARLYFDLSACRRLNPRDLWHAVNFSTSCSLSHSYRLKRRWFWRKGIIFRLIWIEFEHKMSWYVWQRLCGLINTNNAFVFGRREVSLTVFQNIVSCLPRLHFERPNTTEMLSSEAASELLTPRRWLASELAKHYLNIVWGYKWV